ncbi:MAG: hypothetical protein GF331_08675 [Chitinivibrionales bacterium]|nr:hypothetical protein [Chitinivibrionales bacterium]
MERLYADIARAREEVLSREAALADELEKLNRRQDEWRYASRAISDKLDKALEQVTAGFPLGREARMAQLNAVSARAAGDGRPLRTLDALMGYRLRQLRFGARIGLARRTFVVGADEPVTAQVLRIGESMAYGLDPDGGAYYLGATGRMGAEAFAWRRLENPSVSEGLVEAFPRWLETGRLDGTVPVDILQNRYSESLLTGGRRDWFDALKAFAAAGGPVLVPLLVIIVWGLVLIVNRLVTYATRHRRDYRFMNSAVTLLEQGDRQQAAQVASERKSVLARILSECLKHSRWSRASAEKAVRELLLAEMPVLDRHLDTLAVLAAAAPLLGLLGTVTGMIEMFEAITRFGTGDPKLLAGGISEALITTEVGLSIAIPVLLVHNYLRNRRNRIQADMEMYAMRILNRLWPEE